MLGFQFRETMVGHYTREGATRPMRFSLRAHAASLLTHLFDRRSELVGTVEMEGFAERVAATGELFIDPPFGRQIRYRLDFTADDAQPYRFVGEKNLSPRHPVESLVLLEGVIRDSEGREIATAELRFPKRDLPLFLLSWRLVT